MTPTLAVQVGGRRGAVEMGGGDGSAAGCGGRGADAGDAGGGDEEGGDLALHWGSLCCGVGAPSHGNPPCHVITIPARKKTECNQRCNLRSYMPPRSSDWRSPNFHGGTDRGDQSGTGL